MTQISARSLTRDSGAVPAAVIPQPRRSSDSLHLSGRPDRTPEHPDGRRPGATATAPVTRSRARAEAASLDVVSSALVAVLGWSWGWAAPETALAVAVGWPALLLASGHYQLRTMGEDRPARARRVLETWVRASVIALVLLPWSGSAEITASLLLVLATAAASAGSALAGVPRFRARVVLAGPSRGVREALEELAACTTHEVVAACLRRRPKERLDVGLPIHDGLEHVVDVALTHAADVVIVLPGARLSAAEIRRLHWSLAAAGTELCVATGLIDVAPARTRVTISGGLNVVQIAPAPLVGPRRWCKDVVERVLAGVGLVLVLPVLAAIGVAIRLDSPGPVLFRQQRVGRDGRLFWMYKLRSMSTDADQDRGGLAALNEAHGVLFKIHQDPRVTRVGARLRRWSIDELPQLWNVVRGDMSLVGPRPALPDEVARYDIDPRRRLAVKPGCTGLWQVSGRSDLTWEQSVRLDLRYVDNWSLRLDLAIMVRTVSAVLTHRGAY